MYRDEEAAQRSRLSAIGSRIEELVRYEGELRKYLDAVGSQLRTHSRDVARLPTVQRPAVATDVDKGLAMDELARRAEAAEADLARYEDEVAHLARLAEIERGRLEGNGAHLPLGPPPRRVPLSYLLAEWLTPTVAVAVCFGVVVLIGGSLAPIFGIAVWLAGTALLVTGLVWTFILARRKVSFLKRCVVAEEVRLASEEPAAVSIEDIYGPRQATGWDILHRGSTVEKKIVTLSYRQGPTGEVRTHRYRGAPYRKGVLLVDPGSAVSYHITGFRCEPHPDIDGHWVGKTSIVTKICVAATVAATALWLFALPVVYLAIVLVFL